MTLDADTAAALLRAAACITLDADTAAALLRAAARIAADPGARAAAEEAAAGTAMDATGLYGPGSVLGAAQSAARAAVARAIRAKSKTENGIEYAISEKNPHLLDLRVIDAQIGVAAARAAAAQAAVSQAVEKCRKARESADIRAWAAAALAAAKEAEESAKAAEDLVDLFAEVRVQAE